MLKVVAIGINPRIYDTQRDRIQELLDGTHPLSSVRKTYDTGTKKKTVLDQSPLGPDNIADDEDERTSHSGVGSGYNDGGRADDEVGPGNTKNPDPEQDFATPDTSEMTFRNDFDTSSKFSPLNYDSNKRDQNSTTFLRKLHLQPDIKLPKRYKVDRQSSWNHIFAV